MKLACRALGWALAAPLACAADSPLTFDAALALAEQSSPSLAALDARQRAAQARITPAGELPDPQLTLGLDNLPVGGVDAWSLSRDSMTMQRVGLSQALPNAGKRRARVERAAADAEDAGFDVEANRLALRRAAADAWTTARFAAARLALQADLERENQRFQQSIAARYAAGAASAADTLLPRQEALALAARRDDLEAALAVAESALARLLGRPAAVAADAPVPTLEVDATRLRQQLDHHPELRAYDARRDAADAALREAEAARRPDWALAFAYQHRGPRYGEMVSAQVTVDLPFWSARRQAPEIAARAAELEAVDAEAQDAARAHHAELERDLADYTRLARQRDRQRDAALPLAAQALDLAYAGYATGDASLADVLAARRTLAEARFALLDLEAAVLAASVTLHFLNEADDHE